MRPSVARSGVNLVSGDDPPFHRHQAGHEIGREPRKDASPAGFGATILPGADVVRV